MLIIFLNLWKHRTIVFNTRTSKKDKNKPLPLKKFTLQIKITLTIINYHNLSLADHNSEAKNSLIILFASSKSVYGFTKATGESFFEIPLALFEPGFSQSSI